MGAAQTPPSVKLIAGLLAVSDTLLFEAQSALMQRFGPIDAQSQPSDWSYSTYYRDEMGERIRRQFVSFERLIAPGKLAGMKQLTNEMELHWRGAPGRQVNIDPGYVTAMKLVLGSTKDACHRVYLSGGIYAEVTLEYRNGGFQPHAQTYPDYAAPASLAFFNTVRATYLSQLRVLH